MAGLAIRNHAVVGKGSVHQAGLGVGSVEQVFGVIQYKVLPPCRKLRYHQLCQSSFVPATEVCLNPTTLISCGSFVGFISSLYDDVARPDSCPAAEPGRSRTRNLPVAVYCICRNEQVGFRPLLD